MPRVPVRVGTGRLQPALAEAYPWGCASHVARDEPACRDCCGACFWLDPGAGCALGSMKPIRCKTYPLIPRKNRVIIDERCPEAERFVAALQAKDKRALALLEMVKSMSDLAFKEGDDQSAEVAWLLRYTRSGFKGPVLWSRGKLHDAPKPKKARAKPRPATRKRRS